MEKITERTDTNYVYDLRTLIFLLGSWPFLNRKQLKLHRLTPQRRLEVLAQFDRVLIRTNVAIIISVGTIPGAIQTVQVGLEHGVLAEVAGDELIMVNRGRRGVEWLWLWSRLVGS